MNIATTDGNILGQHTRQEHYNLVQCNGVTWLAIDFLHELLAVGTRNMMPMAGSAVQENILVEILNIFSSLRLPLPQKN